MRIRVFSGRDLSSALASLRQALGEDALILETRAVSPEAGGGVEVLAATGDREPDPAPPPAADGALAALRRAFAWHGIGPALAARLLEHDLAHALTKAVAFGDLPLGPADPPLLFAGDPGAGKSLTVIKLATRLVVAGRPPLVISADCRKAGATEQLACMTRLLGLTLIVADDGAQLRRALARRAEGAAVLIDGPGLVGGNAEDTELLRSLATHAAAEIVVVLPAGLDPAEAAEVAQRHALLGARRLVATRLDVSRRLGGILEAAFHARLKLTEGGTGPDPGGCLAPLTATMLATRLAIGGPVLAQEDEEDP